MNLKKNLENFLDYGITTILGTILFIAYLIPIILIIPSIPIPDYFTFIAFYLSLFLVASIRNFNEETALTQKLLLPLGLMVFAFFIIPSALSLLILYNMYDLLNWEEEK